VIVAASAYIETLYPWVSGVLVGGALWHWSLPVRSPDQLLNAGITIGGVLVGFTLTATSILVTLPPTKYRENLVQAGAMRGIISYLLQAAAAALFLVVLSAVLMASPAWLTGAIQITPPPPSAWPSRTMATWAACGTAVFLAVFRVTYLFGEAITQNASSKRSEKKAATPTDGGLS
jgi:hypothetical protein